MAAAASGFRIAFTHHAILRYQQRVRQGLGQAAAARELARLAPQARVIPGRPLWLGEACGHVNPHLVLGDVAFPLLPDASDPDLLWAMTCKVRGGMSDTARERRNARRRSRRQRGGRRGSRRLRLGVGGTVELEHRQRHPCRRASARG
jgi:hypothetical protein